MSETPARNRTKIEVQKLNLYYGVFHALEDVSLRIPEKAITAIIGPSGCGKSTLLKALNRMNDLVPGCRVEGEVLIDEHPIYGQKTDLRELRKKVGMVFQRPTPFPISAYENVAYGPKIHGLADGRNGLEKTVEQSLRATGLWEEIKNKLSSSALSLSPEQQQRLCISRLLATHPEVLLMDEPCSALDPLATARIEELCRDLKKSYTIVIVTHNMQQASRISDFTAYMLLGKLIEFGPTTEVFTRPKDKKTEEYITGRFG